MSMIVAMVLPHNSRQFNISQMLQSSWQISTWFYKSHHLFFLREKRTLIIHISMERNTQVETISFRPVTVCSTLNVKLKCSYHKRLNLLFFPYRYSSQCPPHVSGRNFSKTCQRFYWPVQLHPDLLGSVYRAGAGTARVAGQGQCCWKW